MSAITIGQIAIGDEMCDILKSERTGRFAVCAPNQMTPNFYSTQEEAITKARYVAGESYNLASRAAATGESIDDLIASQIKKMRQ